MIKIFISHSNLDMTFTKKIVAYLSTMSRYYQLLYFFRPYGQGITMETVLNILGSSDLFLLLVTNNALNSIYVQEELDLAMRLLAEGRLKGICPIILDHYLDIPSDPRLPPLLKVRACHAKTAEHAAWIAKKFIQQF